MAGSNLVPCVARDHERISTDRRCQESGRCTPVGSLPLGRPQWGMNPVSGAGKNHGIAGSWLSSETWDWYNTVPRQKFRFLLVVHDVVVTVIRELFSGSAWLGFDFLGLGPRGGRWQSLGGAFTQGKPCQGILARLPVSFVPVRHTSC